MATTDHIDELDLLTKLRDGDHAAFEEVYHRYAKRVAALLFKITKERETAEDLLQDTFVRIWAARHTVIPDQAFSAFAFTIAANLASNALRKRIRQARMEVHMQAKDSEVYAHVEEKLIQQEEYEQLQQALSQLQPRQRQVFIMHKLEGKSYKEISEELGIGHSAINHLIQRANKKLETLLTPKATQVLLLLAALLHEQ